NAGTAAYTAKQFDKAADHLNAALNTPEIASDLATQQRAYYNLGNTLFQLGAKQQEPEERQKLWEQSIATYTNALRLNPQDLDATNNLLYVKRQLEELKKQQQQQQNQDKNNKDSKDQNKDDQKNQDQKNQDQKKDQQNAKNHKKDQKSQQQQQQNSDQDKKDQQRQADNKKSDEEKKKEQQAQADKDKDKDKQQQQAQSKPGEQDKDKKDGEDEAMAQATPMSVQQAKQFLDEQKLQDAPLIFRPDLTNQPPAGKFKDW